MRRIQVSVPIADETPARLCGVLLVVCLAPFACGDSSPNTTDTTSASSEDSASESTTDATSESGSTDTGADTETETDTDTGTETGEPEGNLLLSDQILNIAHRGGGRLRPEATLLAFEHALAAGADVLEFDVQASVDGVLVVLHDDTVDRTTDGTGVVKELSFDELRSFDAAYAFTPDGGQTYPYRGMGVQIPTPEEIFTSFPDQYYLIEIKQDEPSIVSSLLGVLADHGVEERVVVASFQQTTIDEVRAQAPAQLTAMSAAEMVDFYTMGADPNYAPPCLFVQPPWEAVDQQLVDVAHGLGLKVQPWTANTEPLMLDLLGYGVDGIMSDDPVLLGEVIAGF